MNDKDCRREVLFEIAVALTIFFAVCAIVLAGFVFYLKVLRNNLPVSEPPAQETEVVETAQPDGPTYIVAVENAPCNTTPSIPEGEVISKLTAGASGKCITQDGDFVQLLFEDGTTAWVNVWYLDAEDEAEQAVKNDAWLERLKAEPGYKSIESVFKPDDYTFHCTVDSLYVRPSTSTTDQPLWQITNEENVTALGYASGYYLCQLSNGRYGYCAAEGLESNAAYVELDGAVDLRLFMPEMEFELLFASPNNIVGEAMYPAIPLMEQSTADMLKAAEKLFLADGYKIKVYDAYRPKTAQYRLYDIVQDARFIANPYVNNSWHNLGRAIDMSLINVETGEELEMPTPMHTFSTDACRFNADQWSEEARANVEYMTGIMTSVGFGTIETEWWHFENNDNSVGGYMNTNINYDALTYHPLSDALNK